MRRLFFLGIALLIALSSGSVLAATSAAPHFTNVQVSHDPFKAHSEPAIAENPANHLDLIAGSKFFSDPVHYRFKIGMFYSLDGGATWHDTGLLPGFGGYTLTSDISIAFSRSGVAYACLLAVSGKKSGIFVSSSHDGGKTWSNPTTVFLDSTGATFSDKPWIAVDQSHTSSAGTIYVAWNLDGSADKRDPDALRPQAALQTDATPGVVLARSTNGGKTYSAPTLIYNFDRSDAIGAVPAVGPDGELYVAYITFTSGGGDVNDIEVVRSRDKGRTFSSASVHMVNGIPNHLGSTNFRSLSLPTFAVSPHDGSMVVAWSDYGSGDADILASTSTDGGVTWSPPTRVNHDHFANGKDQFMPELAVSPNGTFTCAWFDRRRDPQNRLIDEYIAQSTDDGRTFGHNFRVTHKSWDPSIDAPEPEGKSTNTFIGDYQALAVDNRTVHPLWNDTQDGASQQIRTAVVAQSRLG